MLMTIAITALVTAVVVIVIMNLGPGDEAIERSVEHRCPVRDPQFRREMSVMMGPSITAGNRLQLLQNGDEIFPAMLQAIAGARVSITFESYIYWSGEIGRQFADALSERARAGVPVNVTIDWGGSIKMDQALMDSMLEAGVNAVRYRPLHWYNIKRVNNRTHRKLLVIDGQVGFIGGVGIADDWLGHAQDPDHWRDIHFRVEGPVVAQMQAAFNDNWIKATGCVLNGEKYFPPVQRADGIDAHLFIASPAGGADSMHLMFLLAIAAATESIDLAASYFVPDQLIVDALLAARQRGVVVRIMLPGPHIDSFTVRISSKAEWGPLLEAGVEIHVFLPTMLHTKLLVIDHEFVSVGSTNFDLRSFRLNDEASLNIYDQAFAQQMTTVFEHDLPRTEQYTWQMWKQRPLKERLYETVLVPLKSQL